MEAGNLAEELTRKRPAVVGSGGSIAREGPPMQEDEAAGSPVGVALPARRDPLVGKKVTNAGTIAEQYYATAQGRATHNALKGSPLLATYTLLLNSGVTLDALNGQSVTQVFLSAAPRTRVPRQAPIPKYVTGATRLQLMQAKETSAFNKRQAKAAQKRKTSVDCGGLIQAVLTFWRTGEIDDEVVYVTPAAIRRCSREISASIREPQRTGSFKFSTINGDIYRTGTKKQFGKPPLWTGGDIVRVMKEFVSMGILNAPHQAVA